MSRHRNNVLIVDDEPSVRDSVSRILGKHNYRVETACRGLQAIEKAVSFRPDVVLLDIIMPGIDGYEVCRQLRAITPGIKIIYFTAKVDVNLEDDAEAVNRVDAIIEKPASSETILTCLQRVLA